VVINVTSSSPIGPPSIVISSPQDNSTNSTSSDSKTNTPIFGIGINGISEIDDNGVVVSSLNLSTINFEVDYAYTSAYQNWTITGYSEDGAMVKIKSWFFLQQTTFQFANTTISFPPFSLKYSVMISSWKFSTIRNKLGISFKALADSSKASTCITSQSFDDSNGNLLYFILNVNGVSLYGQIERQIVVDGRIQLALFDWDESSSTVVVKVPFFWNDVEIDPNYSVLLQSEDLKSNQCNEAFLQPQNNTPSHTILMATTVGIAGFIVVVFIVLTLFYKRVAVWCHIKKLDAVLGLKGNIDSPQ